MHFVQDIITSVLSTLQMLCFATTQQPVMAFATTQQALEPDIFDKVFSDNATTP